MGFRDVLVVVAWCVWALAAAVAMWPLLAAWGAWWVLWGHWRWREKRRREEEAWREETEWLTRGDGVPLAMFDYGLFSRARYEGELRNGVPHGHGVLTWWRRPGRRFEGAFVDGERHGHGVETWPDGTRREGEWLCGGFLAQPVQGRAGLGIGD